MQAGQHAQGQASGDGAVYRRLIVEDARFPWRWTMIERSGTGGVGSFVPLARRGQGTLISPRAVRRSVEIVPKVPRLPSLDCLLPSFIGGFRMGTSGTHDFDRPFVIRKATSKTAQNPRKVRAKAGTRQVLHAIARLLCLVGDSPASRHSSSSSSSSSAAGLDLTRLAALAHASKKRKHASLFCGPLLSTPRLTPQNPILFFCTPTQHRKP